jgi:hypothetical protein
MVYKTTAIHVDPSSEMYISQTGIDLGDADACRRTELVANGTPFKPILFAA